MNYYEFRSCFGSEGFVGDENFSKQALGKLLSQLADSSPERTNILIQAVKSAKLDLAVNQSHQKNLVQGKGSADIAWAFYYWLHLNMPNSEELLKIDRQMLAGKSLEDVAGRRVAPDGSIVDDYRDQLEGYEARIAYIEDLTKKSLMDFPGLEIPEFVRNSLGKRDISAREEFSKIFRRIAGILYRNPRDKITAENVDEVVAIVVSDERNRKYTTEQILRFVSSRYSISLSDLLSPRRQRSIARPRQIGMYLAHKMTHDSLFKIGKKFGDRDRNTVLHSARKIRELAIEDTAFGRELAEIEGALLENAERAS